MINAEIEARELQNKLSHICPDAKIDFKIPTANEAVIITLTAVCLSIFSAMILITNSK